MLDDQNWKIATSRLRGFVDNLPTSPSEEDVDHYHSILALLEQSSSCDLSSFRISADRVKPRIVRVIRASRHHAGRADYSEKKFCDPSYFKGQVQGLLHFLPGAAAPGVKRAAAGNYDKTEAAYRALPDFRLQDLAIRLGIKPKKTVDALGARYVFDKEHIIEALLRYDRDAQSASPPVSNFNVHIENMHNSALMQGSSGSTINQHFEVGSEEFRSFVGSLGDTLDQITLSESDRAQASADLSTVKAQIASPKPKRNVVHECMSSIRTILENAAGDLLAAAAVATIGRYFPL